MNCSFAQTNSSFTANGSECFSARSFVSMLIIAGIALAMSVIFCGIIISLRLRLIVIISLFILAVLLVVFLPQRRKG